MAGPAHDLTAAETAALGALGAECARAGVTREVLFLRLSLIPMRDFRPHYARLAESALERLGRADRARLYRLPGHDLALVWRDASSRDALERKVAKTRAISLERATTAALRMLFSAAAVPLPPLAELLCRLRLPADAARLAALLSPAPEPARSTAPERPALDLAELRLVERALASADVARFARRSVIVARRGTSLVQVFDRRFLSLAEIGAELAPGRDLAADPWLLRRLSRTLDRRMLALLAAKGECRAARPIAFPIRVASLLSAPFLAFDRLLPGALRGRLLLELDPADIADDLAAFTFARDFVQTRGYRLILRAPDLALLAALPLAPLGLDFLALEFPALAARSPRTLTGLLPEPSQIILLSGISGGYGAQQMTPDEAAMFAWGEAIGATLFELPRVPS